MILILSSDQFFASIVAKILHGHGIWFGECTEADMFNPLGYFKNKEINKILAARYAGLPEYPLPTEQYGLLQQVCDVISRQGYDGEQIAVVIRPQFQNVFDSQTPFKIAVQQCRQEFNEQIDSIPYQIYGDDLMARNYKTMEKIFAHCRIKFDKGVADAVIDEAEGCE